MNDYNKTKLGHFVLSATIAVLTTLAIYHTGPLVGLLLTAGLLLGTWLTWPKL